MLKRMLHTAQQIVTHEEPHTESVLENTVNAPAQVTVKADGWQGSTDGVNVYDGGSITCTWENAEDRSINVNIGNKYIGVNFGNVFENGGYMSFYCDTDIPIKAYIAYAPVSSSTGFTEIARAYIRKGYNAFVMPSYVFNEVQTGVRIQIRKENHVESPGTPYTFTMSNMFVKTGQEEHDYEPYTGGMPSPSPAYPQDVISTSGVLKATNNGYNADKLRVSQITIPELRAIPGTDIRDELVVYPDGSGKIVRRVWEDRITSYNFTLNNENDNSISYRKRINSPKGTDKCISTHFIYKSNTCSIIIGNGENIYIKFNPKSIMPTLEALKTFLDENEVYILYELEAPIEEPLTAEQVGILRTAQYHTELIWEGLDEHLKPEVEIVAKHIGR